MDLPFAFDAYAERAPAPSGLRALLLVVRGDRYAVRLERVRVVLSQPVITRLPDAAGALLGVTNVRGEVVPVVDTGAVLGVGPLRVAATAAVVDTARGPLALAGGDDPSSVVLDEAVGESDLPLGLVRHRTGDGVATLLDLDALAAVITGAAG
ncbi:hypothetical protein DSM112329_03776 [Paraconexibacter sp. AEG42_29]|uniref:CheW-like domain-containing protein n=1 Tax=Paraconexibacter sp. AEG42_29 TaxID=2997339 RepID=A0AAU7AZ40_9ACTN